MTRSEKGTMDVTIRAFQMSDWEDVADLFQLPRCQQNTLQLPFQSRDALQEKLANPPKNMHRLVAVDPASSRVIGMIGLHTHEGRRSHVGAIGMMVHDDHQNQGVGSALMEALIELAEQWLGLERLELTVYADNPGGLALYRKFGFAQEGVLRCFARRNGTYVDSVTMARLSPNLQALQQSAE